jgi:predicted type IV restriction endonuclease
MKEALIAYVKRVKDLADRVKGNEQATKQSLIGPLFTLLGYDLTDPLEVFPEFRADFGKERSVKPVDWAFYQNNRPIFLVEAKEAGKKLAGYDEQLGDYFAKETEVKLGILTNGVMWRFFTDIINANVMDKEPFVQWDVLNDEHPPYDFLTLLQKTQFKAELVRTFAQQKHARNLLVNELNRLLEPSAEFTKMAITNVETRNLTANVVESWKPVVAAAIEEWARQRTLSMVLNRSPSNDEPATAEAKPAVKEEPTPEEVDGFATVQRLLTAARLVAHEKTASYFKIHLPEKRFEVVCRLYFKQKSSVRVPLPPEVVQPLIPPSLTVKPVEQGWSVIALNATTDLALLGEVFRVTYDRLRAAKEKPAETAPPQADPTTFGVVG